MLTCIVPVYNEKNTVLQVLKDLDGAFFGIQIIVVDNNSTDGSKEIIQNFISGNHANVFEFHECLNQGKANAVISVCDNIQSDTVILHDADGEYSVETLSKLVEAYSKEQCGMAIGLRKNKLLRSKIVNFIIKHILKFRYGVTVSDVLTGARILPKSILMQCRSKSFGLETEITKLVIKNQLKIVERDCIYSPRTKGKKIKSYHFFELVRIALC